MNKGYHVFIDESEDHANKMEMLGAVLIRDVDLASINKEMTVLRSSMSRAMRRHKYVVYSDDETKLFTGSMRTESRRLRAGGLPEIHTQHIWRSDNEFYTLASDEAVERRNNWLYSVAQIFARYPIIFLTRRFEGKLRSFQNEELGKGLTALESALTPDVSRKEVNKMLKDVHFNICFELFLKLDSLSERDINILSITCDRGKRSERYEHFLGFDAMREYGYWQNFPNPKFEPSHESNGLQLADFANYIQMRIMHPNDNYGYIATLAPYIRRRHSDILTSVDSSQPHQATKPSERHSNMMVAMFYEAALLHCGGRQQTLPTRRAALQRLLSLLLRPVNVSHTMVEAQVASYRGPVWHKDTTWLNHLQEETLGNSVEAFPEGEWL